MTKLMFTTRDNPDHHSMLNVRRSMGRFAVEIKSHHNHVIRLVTTLSDKEAMELATYINLKLERSIPCRKRKSI